MQLKRGPNRGLCRHFASFSVKVFASFCVKVSTLIIPVSPLHPELCAVAGLPEVCTGCLYCVNLHVWIKSHSATLANQRPVIRSVLANQRTVCRFC